MKRYVFIIPILLVVSCFKVERNCQDYKTGVFEFKYSINSIEKVGRFKRINNLSIDYFNGKVDTSSIRWINDCEFILKKVNPKSMSEKNPIHFKILSTTDSSYTFEYKLALDKPNTNKLLKRGIAFKIK